LHFHHLVLIANPAIEFSSKTRLYVPTVQQYLKQVPKGRRVGISEYLIGGLTAFNRFNNNFKLERGP
jgi:hypothetical protein